MQRRFAVRRDGSASSWASSKRSSIRAAMPDLLVDRREVVLRRDESVVDGLEHRLHRGERRAQVVARPGHELAATSKSRSRFAPSRYSGVGASASSAVELSGARRSSRPAARPSAVAEAAPGPRRSIERNSAPITAAVDDAAATPSTARSWSESNITAPEAAPPPAGRAASRRRTTTSCDRSVRSRRRASAIAHAQRNAQRLREKATRSRHEPVARCPTPSGAARGCDGSSSSFSRSRRTWTVTVPVSFAER